MAEVEEICVGWFLPRRVCTASGKQEHVKENIVRCLVAEKNLGVQFSVQHFISLMYMEGLGLA